MENNKSKVRYGVPQEPEGMTVKQLKANAIKKWYLFVIFTLLGVGVAFLYNKMASPKYKIASTILIKNDNRANDLQHVFNEAKLNKGNTVIHDQVGVIKSFTLNLMAMQSLNWHHAWYKKELFGTTDLYGKDPFTLEIPKGAIQAHNVPIIIKPGTATYVTVSCDVKHTIDGREVDFSFEKRLNYGEEFKNKHFNFIITKKNRGN